MLAGVGGAAVLLAWRSAYQETTRRRSDPSRESLGFFLLGLNSGGRTTCDALLGRELGQFPRDLSESASSVSDAEVIERALSLVERQEAGEWLMSADWVDACAALPAETAKRPADAGERAGTGGSTWAS